MECVHFRRKKEQQEAGRGHQPPHQVNTTQRPPDPGPGSCPWAWPCLCLARGRGRGRDRATFATAPHSSASTSKQPARPSLAQATGCTRSRHRAGRGHQQPHQVNTKAPPDTGPGSCPCQHPAAGAGHRAPHTPQRQASHTQRVSSGADKGAKGDHFSRPFPGSCVRIR